MKTDLPCFGPTWNLLCLFIWIKVQELFIHCLHSKMRIPNNFFFKKGGGGSCLVTITWDFSITRILCQTSSLRMCKTLNAIKLMSWKLLCLLTYDHPKSNSFFLLESAPICFRCVMDISQRSLELNLLFWQKKDPAFQVWINYSEHLLVQLKRTTQSSYHTLGTWLSFSVYLIQM